jgi:hypothetical protein
MPYWSGELDGCDFAFDSVGVIVLQTVKQLEREADLVLEKQFPEQSILALLSILDKLMEIYPKCVSVHFGKGRYLVVKEKFMTWHSSCAKIPRKHRDEFATSMKSPFDEIDAKFGVDS